MKKNFSYKVDNPVSTNTVNINHLMSKIIADKKKIKKENIVFMGLVGSVVLITGLISSL